MIRWSKVLPILAPVLVLIAIVSMWKVVWTLGSDSDDWKPVCVHGQLVYRANFAAKAMAVNALTEDGKPISCTIEEE